MGTAVRGLCLVMWLGACATGSSQSGLSQGDPDGPPSLNVLPDMASDASGNTDRTHQGLLEARRVLNESIPAPPVDRAHRVLQGWMDTEVVRWLEQRNRAVDDTRYLFTFGDASVGEGIVSHAVIGVLHEDTAVTLEQLPMPAELDTEPAVAAEFRDILREQAKPFVNSALIEYRDCANEAFRGPPDMLHWAHFCEARFYRLRQDTADPGNAPTVGISTPES